MSISGDIIHMSDKDNKFFDDIITGYETWCFLYGYKKGNLFNGNRHFNLEEITLNRYG